MFDFQTARRNMVDCQIHTSGIIRPEILEAFSTVPREMFVPPEFKSIAYSDEEIPLGQGRFLLASASHARMIQALELTSDCVVLDIGGASGFSAAILSSMASAVIALESDRRFEQEAAKMWQDLECCNVAAMSGPLKEGCPQNAPYDAIFVSGAVAQVPHKLLEQLADGGRMVVIVKGEGKVMGDVMLIRRTGSAFSSYKIFEAGASYLKEFTPEPAFQF